MRLILGIASAFAFINWVAANDNKDGNFQTLGTSINIYKIFSSFF